MYARCPHFYFRLPTKKPESLDDIIGEVDLLEPCKSDLLFRPTKRIALLEAKRFYEMGIESHSRRMTELESKGYAEGIKQEELRFEKAQRALDLILPALD